MIKSNANLSEIWILEDEEDCLFVYRQILSAEFQIREIKSLAEFDALLATAETSPRLLIADLRLKDGHFLEWLFASQEKSESFEFPILVVSSSDDLNEMKLAMNQGAVDYLVKPFRTNELLIKIEFSDQRDKQATLKWQCESSSIELISDSLLLKNHLGFELSLTPKEVQIMSRFLRNPNHQVTRKELQDQVWRGIQVGAKTLDVHLVNLRRKLDRLGYELTFMQPERYVLQPSANLSFTK